MSPLLPWCPLACQSLYQWEHMAPRWSHPLPVSYHQQSRHHHTCFLIFLFSFLFGGGGGAHLALLGGSSQFSTEKLFWAAHLCGTADGTQIASMQLMQPSLWVVLANFFLVLQRIYEYGLMNNQLSQIKWSFLIGGIREFSLFPVLWKSSRNHRRKDFDFCLPLSTHPHLSCILAGSVFLIVLCQFIEVTFTASLISYEWCIFNSPNPMCFHIVHFFHVLFVCWSVSQPSLPKPANIHPSDNIHLPSCVEPQTWPTSLMCLKKKTCQISLIPIRPRWSFPRDRTPGT